MDSGNQGYSHMDDNGQGARRRYVEGAPGSDNDPGVYDELERLRGIVDVMEGGKKGCLKLGLNNSAMSTIFGLVFIVIVTVTIYAFTNLYRALSKRFFPPDV